MTKQQMIEVIQQKEADAFLQLKVDEKLFGHDHIITSKSRGEWCKINSLMEELEIEPNNQLPENQSAITLIIEGARERTV